MKEMTEEKVLALKKELVYLRGKMEEYEGMLLDGGSAEDEDANYVQTIFNALDKIEIVVEDEGTVTFLPKQEEETSLSKNEQEEHLDKICYRFRIEDIGVPEKTKEGFKIKRVMFYDEDCKESLIPHTNIHGHLGENGTIKKIKDGEYENYKGKSIWKNKQIQKELESKGGGEKSYWIKWEIPKPKPLPPPITFEACIYPDQNSDYVSEKGTWTSKGKQQLESIRDVLNREYKLKSFKSLKIKISYNCGSPRSLTGANCAARAKNCVKNTIKRLIQLGLNVPVDSFKITEIDAFQTDDYDISKRGAKITISPVK